jgi:hypothetical protein
MLLALSGCAGIPGVGGQTNAQACKILSDSVSSATSDLSSSFSSIASDPSAAVKKLDGLADDFDGGLKKVTNTTVKAAGEKASTSLKEMVKQVKDVVAHPKTADTSKVTAAATKVQTDFTAIGKVCK